MASGEVVIQSMWSPAVTAVRTRGIACEFVPLKEGYRGWGVTLVPLKHLTGLKLDAAMEYLNWYNSGWQGAFIARQGYYGTVPETTKATLEPYEWDYWYEGKPAAKDITDPFGELMEKAGNKRDGGALWERMGNVAVWNCLMDRAALSDQALERIHLCMSLAARINEDVAAEHVRRAQRKPWPGALVSWLQAAPLALVLLLMFVAPLAFVVVVSFFDYDRMEIYPSFMLDNYIEIFTSEVTLRLYLKTFEYSLIVEAITLVLGFFVAYFLTFHVRTMPGASRCCSPARSRSSPRT